MTRRLVLVFLLGFSSGLPLLLTSQTLHAWLTAAGASLDQIAQVSLVGLAYTFKFLWAPLLDRFALPVLGRRRGWMIATQLGLAGAIVAMGQLDPIATPGVLFAMASLVALLGASQDIVIDAYKADLLVADERAAGASAYVIGYRAALLVSGTLALILADHLPWPVIYALLAAMLAIGVVATLFAEEPAEPEDRPSSLQDAIVKPFVELWRRLGTQFWILVAFTVLYRFGDYLAQAVIIPFFHRAAGFEMTEIGVIYQALGFAGIAAGGLLAGVLVPRYGMKRMLVACGVAQAATNLLYIWLAHSHHDLTAFSSAVLIDNTANMAGAATFTAYLMSVCSPAVSATQFALLTSLASVGQRVFGPFADDIVRAVDWSGFFTVTTLAAVPGIVLIRWLQIDRSGLAGPRSDAGRRGV